MRNTLLVILLAIAGCAGRPAAPITSSEMEKEVPIVPGFLSVTLGEPRELAGQSLSAALVIRWIETTVTCTNTSDHPIGITGHPGHDPFHHIHVRADESSDWIVHGPWHCGTGAVEIQLAPGASRSFTVVLPDEHAGQEFRVGVGYRKTAEKLLLQAVSEPRRLERPAATQPAAAAHDADVRALVQAARDYHERLSLRMQHGEPLTPLFLELYLRASEQVAEAELVAALDRAQRRRAIESHLSRLREQEHWPGHSALLVRYYVAIAERRLTWMDQPELRSTDDELRAAEAAVHKAAGDFYRSLAAAPAR